MPFYGFTWWSCTHWIDLIDHEYVFLSEEKTISLTFVNGLEWEWNWNEIDFICLLLNYIKKRSDQSWLGWGKGKTGSWSRKRTHTKGLSENKKLVYNHFVGHLFVSQTRVPHVRWLIGFEHASRYNTSIIVIWIEDEE